MTTREEIEAAKKRRLHYFVQGSPLYPGGFIQREADAYTLADAYLAERAERQRRIEAAVREILGSCNVGCICAQCEDRMRDIITRHLDGEN